MPTQKYTDSFRKRLIRRVEKGEEIRLVALNEGVPYKTIYRWAWEAGVIGLKNALKPDQNGHVVIADPFLPEEEDADLSDVHVPPLELVPISDNRIIDLLERCTIALERLAGAWDGKE